MDTVRAVLTAKQERFCAEYLVDLNATGAARRAGYSEATAGAQASRLLTNVKVKERIAKLQGAVAERLEVSAGKVITLLFDLHRDARLARQFGPSVRAVELLGRTLGLFKDKVELSPLDAVDDAVVIERLAKGDPAVVAMLTRLIGKAGFDA